MVSGLIYNEDLWERFVAKIEKADKPKTYKHFDNIFDFSKNNAKIKATVSDPTFQQMALHSFAPHLKILTKTPRYKFDETINTYDLETKIRPISFSSHFDSYLYSFYAFALTEAYQDYIKSEKFDHCVLAYRSDLNGDCNIQFAKKAFDLVKSMIHKHGRCSAIALDITGYFDNIDHEVLKEKWCDIVKEKIQLPLDQYKIFRSLTTYSYVGKASFLKHFDIDTEKPGKYHNLLDLLPDSLAGANYIEKFNLIRGRRLVVRNKPKKNSDGTFSNRGIPQGSPMSSVLSNIYLIDFDRWLANLGRLMGFSYMRYCDDLLIICKSKDVVYLNNEIITVIKERYKLAINSKKTEVVEFRPNSVGKIRGFNIKKPEGRRTTKSNEQRYYKSLQYLGFEFNGENIYIRPGSLSRYFRKAKGRVLKTMMMAYGKKSKKEQISKKQLYFRYTHFGKRNFITYAQNAAKQQYVNSEGIVRPGLDSISIKRQLSSHFAILEKELVKTSKEFAKAKGRKPKK
ncbi:reverse transcriptase domain-containing protein [Pedobacter helvus]|uniref:Reverse transcriptase domain-containing protein n=1 Tax=Pedobacter helvus TaxID=2563444 RepID=A0ABW9JJ75_9SPHI|nr:reverse transcriptase domain-containing protein [Pedobacter ureilyticus]